jgi:hypothetical protein
VLILGLVLLIIGYLANIGFLVTLGFILLAIESEPACGS